MAALVSKDSEDIYTDLASPYQDVYSTLGQTSLNSPGAQYKGHSGLSSHPYRRAAACLGLLCALLLAATLVLCVLYTSLSGTYSMLERDLEELRSSCSTMNKEKVQQQSRVCEPCPQGWEQFSCKCYYFSNETKNWPGSRSDCIKQGADMVIIDSDEEQRFINNKTKNDAWIGLRYPAFTSNWLWVDGTPLQKGFWGSGDPYVKSGFNCAMTATKTNALDAYYCSTNQNWICETNALLP